MYQLKVSIAGGGIGGLAMALTLEQIGVPFTLYEATPKIAALGVGINLQPNAVRELFELGIGPEKLDAIGIPAKEWALVGLNGKDIYAEPRGLDAGYNWPQYSVHRGQLQLLLYQTLVDRVGEDAVLLGQRVTGYKRQDDGTVAVEIESDGGARRTERASILIAADGIHSAVRDCMHPGQPPINWGGAVMWRGTTRARPIRTGASFVGLGTSRHRLVIYPISHPDPQTGLATINWIAEVTMDNSRGWAGEGWFRPVSVDEFAGYFRDWRYDWLDVPDLLSRSDMSYENPMIDRDPVPTWQDGPVVLLGDAAHAMYPTGSNGASQAIVDARLLGASFLKFGVSELALAEFDRNYCGPVSEIVLRNRGAGPFGILNLIEERCGGEFDDINLVMPPQERDAFMSRYKSAAGFAKEQLNSAPPTIAAGQRVGGIAGLDLQWHSAAQAGSPQLPDHEERD